MSSIDRYMHPGIAGIFNGRETRRRWLLIELAHLQRVATLPEARDLAEELKTMPSHMATVVLGSISDDEATVWEQKVGHDVGGFLALVEKRFTQHGFHQVVRWLHWGLTSSDLVDTSNAIAVNRAMGVLQRDSMTLANHLLALPETPLAGRTHGQVASPTTLRDRFDPLVDSLLGVKVRGFPAMLSGAVGQHRVFSGDLADLAIEALGGFPVSSSQVMPPKWFDEQLNQINGVVWAVEKLGLDLRLMAMLGEYVPVRSEVGSSTMPSKVNPYLAERLCGLAKLWRGLHSAWSESRALWLERDLHHSSVDRATLGPMLAIAGYMVKLADRLIREATWPAQDMSRFEPAIDADLLLGESTARVNLPRTAVYARVREAIREEQSEMGFRASTDGVRARLGWF